MLSEIYRQLIHTYSVDEWHKVKILLKNTPNIDFNMKLKEERGETLLMCLIKSQWRVNIKPLHKT